MKLQLHMLMNRISVYKKRTIEWQVQMLLIFRMNVLKHERNK